MKACIEHTGGYVVQASGRCTIAACNGHLQFGVSF